MEWQLQEAKNRLSQLLSQASHEGPQVITVRGKPAVIVLSIEEYERLTTHQTKLSEFFAESPLRGEGLEFERDQDLSREVEL